MLQGILQEVAPDREGLLSCEDLARCLRRPDPAPEPQEGLADFLKDADIRLVRADFILKLQKESDTARKRLPRRQEAESAYVDSRTALVTHEEVQAWADGKAPEGTQIVSLSHCWESREHCDPYGYQVAKLAKKQNVSFGRAMKHMHVLYCHEKSSTLRIESLTPKADIAEAERKQEGVMMYHHPTGLVKPVPVTELVKNRTPYKQRGWCAAEREWSSTRTATNLSREVDAPEGEKGGIAPMVPEAFRQSVANQLKFTHLDDVETVCRLQAEVYKEKAEMCKSLRLVDLGAEALDIALSGLERYPVLESLEIVHCELSQKLPLLLKVLKENKLPQLHLKHNELFEEGTRQVVEARRQLPMHSAGMVAYIERHFIALWKALALQLNGTLAALSVGHDRIGVAGVKALAEVLQNNSTLIELNLSHVCLDSDMVCALAKAVKQNHTLKQLSLAGAKVEIAEPLLEALRASQLQVDLTDSDLGNGVAVAMARALRTGQVKGTVTHPAMEFLCMLEARAHRPRPTCTAFRGEEAERFRRLFGPLCRALPKLPEPLRELELDLRFQGDAFGLGPGAFRSANAPARPLSGRQQFASRLRPRAAAAPRRPGHRGLGLRPPRADGAEETLFESGREQLRPGASKKSKPHCPALPGGPISGDTVDPFLESDLHPSLASPFSVQRPPPPRRSQKSRVSSDVHSWGHPDSLFFTETTPQPTFSEV
ncbi:NLRC3 [Symbiodinium sp. CCMP2592]|nr:NLRC3 [Symbiodinium sp. CCMP2592]